MGLIGEMFGGMFDFIPGLDIATNWKPIAGVLLAFLIIIIILVIVYWGHVWFRFVGAFFAIPCALGAGSLIWAHALAMRGVHEVEEKVPAVGEAAALVSVADTLE